MQTNETGRRGEAICAAWYEAKGYTIRARNYHTRRGEIDVIAENGEQIVFIEVKTRGDLRFGLPCEAVGTAKQRRIILAAMQFLLQHPIEKQPRFDVFEVWLQKDQKTKVRCLEAAFDTSVLEETDYF